VISNVIQVRIKKGETVDRALKRLKKVLDKEGLMREIRNHRYFEKPSEQRRREKARARIRARLQGR
jgi:small subunit ribosomal protein S21